MTALLRPHLWSFAGSWRRGSDAYRSADRVVFPDDGRVVERGTHGERGRYAAFWDLAMAPVRSPGPR